MVENARHLVLSINGTSSPSRGRTDKESSTEYYKSDKRWCSFQDNIAESNSEKVDKKNVESFFNRSCMAEPRIYARELNLSKLRLKRGVEFILRAMYKRDPLSVVSLVFQELQALLMVRRENHEQFDDLEMRLVHS